MFFIQDLNQQVILFVGRPTDLRKGLSLLFESLAILIELTAVPLFHVWIVGGSPRETAVILNMIDLIGPLRALRVSGRLMVWGRVENIALSELYSRALVTVIPSHREEFGIVAVEAMMCGCPVVAAKTGGLTDIVSNGKTGVLFEPDDAAMLAAVLCAYLRNPKLRTVQSDPTRVKALARFSHSAAYTQLSRLYAVDADQRDKSEHTIPTQAFHSKALAESRHSRIKTALKSEALTIVQISDTRHPVFRIESNKGKWCAKFFVDWISQQASVFGHSSNLSVDRGASISYFRALYNRDNPVAPVLRHFDDTLEPFVVCDWLEPADSGATSVTDEVVNTTIQRYKCYKPLEDTEILAKYLRALEAFSKMRDDSCLEAFDLASAQLNSCINGGQLLLCRSHPQVELARARQFLANRAWPVSDHFRVRAMQLIDILDRNDFIMAKPELAHGDLKLEHFLIDATGKIRLAGCEHSRYAVGPLDLAIWLCESAWSNPHCSAQEILDRMINVLAGSQDRFLCVCWIVAEVLFRALLGFSNGQCTALATANRIFGGLGVLLLNRGFTR